MKLHRTPRLPAPEISPWEWANGAPGGLSTRRGSIVLVSFFSWSDPETVRSLPGLDEIADRYRGAGLEVLGVHVPVEEFERPLDAAREEVWRLGVTYPVALDLTADVSRAYENRMLPGRFLVDRAGFLRGWRHGYGGEEELERAVRILLREKEGDGANGGATAANDASLPEPLPRAAINVWAPSAPLRFAMPPNVEGAKPGLRTFPELPEMRAQGVPYFEGAWDLRVDRAVAAAAGTRLAVVYEGGPARAVLSPPREEGEPVFLDATLDGEPLPRVTIDRGRVYDLGTSAEFGVHHLDLVFAPGLAVHRLHFDPSDAPLL